MVVSSSDAAPIVVYVNGDRAARILQRRGRSPYSGALERPPHDASREFSSKTRLETSIAGVLVQSRHGRTRGKFSVGLSVSDSWGWTQTLGCHVGKGNAWRCPTCAARGRKSQFPRAALFEDHLTAVQLLSVLAHPCGQHLTQHSTPKSRHEAKLSSHAEAVLGDWPSQRAATSSPIDRQHVSRGDAHEPPESTKVWLQKL